VLAGTLTFFLRFSVLMKLTPIFALFLYVFASGKELSFPKRLHHLVSLHSNSTNKELTKMFQNPQVLLSVMEKGDPKEINEVISFIDSIIEQSEKDKEDILACRDEKQAFVDDAVKKRITETEEHTKIAAELEEAREKVKESEIKEDDKITLENARERELEAAKKEVETCEDEVTKVVAEVNEETQIYNKIIELLKECVVSEYEFEYIAGPKVANSLSKPCSDGYEALADAEAACSAEPDCTWLHDRGCDNKNWRWCSSSVDITKKGKKKSCSILRTKKSTSSSSKVASSEPEPASEPVFEPEPEPEPITTVDPVPELVQNSLAPLPF